MKKRISLFLAVILMFSVFPPGTYAAGNAPAEIWNAADNSFQLKKGPEITRIAEDSTEDGTNTMVWYRATDEFHALADYYFANDEYDEAMYAAALGLDRETVSGLLRVNVQFAYSFDGNTWVNDFSPDTEENPDDYNYWIRRSFDLDGDGYEEYYDLPNYELSFQEFFSYNTLFAARWNHFIPEYCDAEESGIRDALQLANQTMLQGKGEFTGSAYDLSDQNRSRGFMVDFNKHTLYVKARYRVYNELSVYANDEWEYLGKHVYLSDWGSVKTFNNATSSIEKQNCAPDMKALNTSKSPTIRILSTERWDVEREEGPVKSTRFRIGVDYPAATYKALAQCYALDDYAVREQFTGETYEPDLVIEMKAGNGDWYYYHDFNANETCFEFDDDYYTNREFLEDIGYQPGDPVYLRARLYGTYSYKTEQGENEKREKVYDSDTVSIRSGLSNVLELSLNGKYSVYYDTDGGAFPRDSVQLTIFDGETDVTVDLTAKDYTPEKEHYAFDGWYTTEDFAAGTGITKFDTKEKASRTYYAKWTELPYHSVSYDMGTVTDYVYNPNAERVYSDDGTVDVNDVSYESAKFLGWYDAKEGGKRVTSLSYADMKADVTLYARWELPTKSIKYDGADKDYTNDKRNPAAYQINPDGANTVAVYAPEKRGFIFDGWFLNKNLKDGALSYNEEKGCWELNETEDVTLYAKWIRGRWDIRYELNLTDAWNGNNPDNYTFGDGVLLAEPTRTGYTFNGWYADAAFKTKATQITGEDVGEKTFYAKWTAIQYKIAYDLRDPDAAACFGNENPTVRTVDDEIVLQPLTPVLKQYKFLGWYDNVNFDNDPVEIIRKGTDKDVTLYAKLFKYSWGDVDFDGDVSAADARLVLRAAVELEELPADALAWGDVDAHSAKHDITAADARLALRIAVGLDSAASLGLPALPAGF